MSNIAIRCEGLGKGYRLGGVAPHTGLSVMSADATQRRFRFAGALLRGQRVRKEKAGIRSGRCTTSPSRSSRARWSGIIGRNGAGKSTLLKLLSRITEPTRGSIKMRGHVASLLEVGTGFHPELTGRENIFLNGAILGMSKAEIRRKFDEIVAFAEVEQFIDTPVKRYSSGHVCAAGVRRRRPSGAGNPDRGRSAGGRRCGVPEEMPGQDAEVSRQGRTVLFVSHNMTALRNLCTRALWFADGSIVEDGEASSVVAKLPAAQFDIATGIRVGRSGNRSGQRPGAAAQRPRHSEERG